MKESPQPRQGLVAPPPSLAQEELGSSLNSPETAAAPTAQEQPPVKKKPEIVIVAELTEAELDEIWTGALYVPSKDRDVFVRCQHTVISYCTYYAPRINKGTYTLDEVYRQARKIARPLAALGAQIPLTFAELSEHAFVIYDSIASWANADDAAAHAIGKFFYAYAIPLKGGQYRNVRVPRTPRDRK